MKKRKLRVQRAYALLVRLHGVYGMHSIFAPGFPGLLEAFYVQERLIEWLVPDVYKSFVRMHAFYLILAHALEATECDIIFRMGDEVVHHPLREHRAFRSATPIVGCVMARWS